MSIVKIVAIGLIVVGILGLVYGGFSYVQKTHNLTMGSSEMALSLKDKQMVAIPIAAGVMAIAVAVFLLVLERRTHERRLTSM